MNVRLITKTSGVQGTEFYKKSIDEMLVAIARVSSNKSIEEIFLKPHVLIRYLLLQGHWSPFTMSNMTFEIKTSRAIGREILRHKMEFQEFSQRYMMATEFEPIELREQCKDNRQSSYQIFHNDEHPNINDLVDQHVIDTESLYNYLLNINVARETARMVLPETTTTTIYANSTIRGWLSFLNQRLHKTAQKEIRLIAEEIKNVFLDEVPLVSAALYNFDNAENVHIFDRLILEKYKVYDEAMLKNK